MFSNSILCYTAELFCTSQILYMQLNFNQFPLAPWLLLQLDPSMQTKHDWLEEEETGRRILGCNNRILGSIEPMPGPIKNMPIA